MIYDRPTKTLMLDFIKERVRPGQVFDRGDAVDWFKAHYAKINTKTVEMHVEGMAVNNPVRRHHSNIEPGAGYDLFYKVGPQKFRLWDSTHDPAPRYKPDLMAEKAEGASPGIEAETWRSEANSEDDHIPAGGGEFDAEEHLRDYLSNNLKVLEKGLSLYQDEGFTGVEYPVGGRFHAMLKARLRYDAVDRLEHFMRHAIFTELTIKGHYSEARQIVDELGAFGINLSHVAVVLEREGVAAFAPVALWRVKLLNRQSKTKLAATPGRVL